MFKLFKHFKNALRFTNLSADDRRLTFYSEGKNYWPHLGGLVEYILENSDLKVNFITSGADDPAFHLNHPNLSVFKIDDGHVRNWLFENIETELFIMTMPDIDKYQVKRSKHSVHYLYVQHALMSLHMVYRKGAFDHYDTIFCSGPHHVREMRAIEKAHGLEPKILVEHGYAWLDSIIAESKSRKAFKKAKDAPKHILIAPSWGPEGVIEIGVGAKLADHLLSQGYQVTLRPHPETIKHAKSQVDAIVSSHKSNPLFSYETNVAGQESLHNSDVMITAWSGTAFDYGFGLGKPVVFIDVPKKLNNPDYENVPLPPVEIYIREELGTVISADEIESLDIEALKPPSQKSIDAHVFNLGHSDQVGGNYIINWIKPAQERKT
ncbi:MAG: CDP-glycerol--glycerophosphate glycerophosphotransferase [Acidimicrobiales bacterium]|nr:CDP-glycerol--glycerophosphate glycerophosphotransferase [Hyphomonadaceae bacterium]RZV41577.1 MAG: CDP-glycerol--glycerophosphate glycerophosphotransferase [Acidimicrobiales bacterium]